RAFALGLDTEAALKTALDTDYDRLQAGFDQSMDRAFGAVRRALTGVDDEAVAAMPLEALRAYAVDHARSYQVQMALGRKLATSGDLDGAMQAFERAAALVPVARGKGSPHAEMAAIALKKDDRVRAIAELQALIDVDFDNIDAARQLA